MKHNGVREFPFTDKQGKAGTCSPEVLYITGSIFLAGTMVSAILFQIDRLKTKRAKTKTKDTLLPDD